MGWQYTLRSSESLFNYTKHAPVPSCFANEWSRRCGIRNGNIFGDCDGGYTNHNTLGQWLGGFVPTAYDAGGYWWGYAMGTRAFYMDKNCRYVSSIPQGTELCGFAGVSWSPISLILDESQPLDAEMSVVSFSLDHNNPDAYSLWKGSKTAPLLVFDPEHTGEVKSVTQLFGNWSFGGRRASASLSTMALDSSKGAPWNNGYEALALLDSDHNKRIEGAEVQSLALWFDENRNAEVDGGELKSLADVGISALLYSDVTAVPGSRDLQVVRGFERNINGTTVVGRTVDWYGESFGSYQEAIAALGVLLSATKPEARGDAQASADTQNVSLNEVAASQENPLEFSTRMTRNVGHDKDLTGFWVWGLNEKFGAQHPGFLAMREDERGAIQGYSVVETELARNSLDLRSAVRILPLRGHVVDQPDGSRRLDFEVIDPKSGSIARSQAMIGDAGLELRGKSTQRFTGPKGQSANVDYAWTGRKVISTGKKTSSAG